MPNPFHVVAHRGNSTHFPENTLPAFLSAIELGADEIELDVHVTSDGVAVVVHDATLARTTGNPAAVKDVTFAELRRLDAGAWKGERFAGTRIPTLDEVLDVCFERVPLEIELKAAGAVGPTVAALQKRAHRDAFRRVLLTCFEQELLHGALALEPRLAVGPLVRRSAPLTPRQVKDLGFSCLLPHWPTVTPQLVEEAHRLRLPVRGWGVNDLPTAQALIDSGGDGCTYNDPGELLGYLANSGRRDHPLPLPPLASWAGDAGHAGSVGRG
jgi:glycerophosphoryl diester phosphodiesterase